jgi:hypothetical protein
MLRRPEQRPSCDSPKSSMKISNRPSPSRACSQGITPDGLISLTPLQDSLSATTSTISPTALHTSAGDRILRNRTARIPPVYIHSHGTGLNCTVTADVAALAVSVETGTQLVVLGFAIALDLAGAAFSSSRGGQAQAIGGSGLPVFAARLQLTSCVPVSVSVPVSVWSRQCIRVRPYRWLAGF